MRAYRSRDIAEGQGDHQKAKAKAGTGKPYPLSMALVIEGAKGKDGQVLFLRKGALPDGRDYRLGIPAKAG